MTVIKQVFQCDRCGRSGEKKGSGAFANGGIDMQHVKHWGFNSNNETHCKLIHYDLCFHCAQQFEAWLDGKNTIARSNGYEQKTN